MNETSLALDNMFERFPEVKSYKFEYFDGSIHSTKFAIGLTEDGLLSANGGFNFNERFFSDFEHGLREAFGQQTDGTLVRGDGTFSTLVRHEYGHNVQNYIETKIAMKHHETVDNWRLNFGSFDEYKAAQSAYRAERDAFHSELRALAGMKGSSEYSNTNELELFAEGFAEYTSGANTEFGKAFGEFLRKWY